VLAVIEALCDAVAFRAKRSAQAAANMTEFVLPWLTDTSTLSAHSKTATRPTPKQAKKKQ
jgi:hypothetical protein